MRTRHVCASVIKVMECIQMQDGSPSTCDEVVHALCRHDDDDDDHNDDDVVRKRHVICVCVCLLCGE